MTARHKTVLRVIALGCIGAIGVAIYVGLSWDFDQPPKDAKEAGNTALPFAPPMLRPLPKATVAPPPVILPSTPELEHEKAIRLTPEGGERIVGLVVDDKGRGVAGAMVFGSYIPTSIESRAKQAQATTDGAGRFELRRKPSDGNVPVFAWSPGYAASWAKPENGKVTITLMAGGSISGRCFRDGKALQGIRICLGSGEIWDTDETVTNANGSYLIANVPSGIVELKALSKPDEAPYSRVAEVVQGKTTVVDFNLPSVQGTTVSGTVLVDGQPATGGTINVVVELENAGTTETHGGVDPDGTFEIADVPMGHATLHFRGRTTEGERVYENESFEVPGNGDVVIDMSLNTSTRLVVDMVRSDPKAQAAVWVMPGVLSDKELRWSDIQALSPLSAGMANPKAGEVCKFLGLSAGTYTVIGVEVPNNITSEINAILGRVTFDMKVVEVKEGAETSIELNPTS